VVVGVVCCVSVLTVIACDRTLWKISNVFLASLLLADLLVLLVRGGHQNHLLVSAECYIAREIHKRIYLPV
jgi:hypothetical protein